MSNTLILNLRLTFPENNIKLKDLAQEIQYNDFFLHSLICQKIYFYEEKFNGCRTIRAKDNSGNINIYTRWTIQVRFLDDLCSCKFMQKIIRPKKLNFGFIHFFLDKFIAIYTIVITIQLNFLTFP